MSTNGFPLKKLPHDIDFRVQKLLAEATIDKGGNIPRRGSTEEGKEVSEFMGAEIPRELGAWIKMCVGPVEMKNVLVGFSMFDDERNVYHFQSILKDNEFWRKKKWIPIACDRFGNYYLMPIDDQFGELRPVFFIDMMEDSTSPQYAVSSHLFYFLQFLLEEELGSEYWPFEKNAVLAVDPNLSLVDGVALPWTPDQN